MNKFQFSAFIFCILLAFNLQAQYISTIYEYTPAPGQFTNTENAGSPQAAEHLIGGVNPILSLGACGGYIIFGFEQAVENHPDNPFGVDFTIFGNPMQDWSEAGVVYVMRDDNNNGLPDDTWYELAGSDYFFSDTQHHYSITYTNPNDSVDVPWSDNQGNTGVIESNSYHKQPYYPKQTLFPHIPTNEYTLKGTKLNNPIDNVGGMYKSYQRAFGYADNLMKKSAPYTLPDNPYTEEQENAGGDAFDISWAVDSLGQYVDLDKIHFVKVQTAVQGQAGWLGELSTDLAGAVVVEPNPEITGIEDVIVIKPLPKNITTLDYQLEAFVFHKGRKLDNAILEWECSIPEAWVDENNVLHLPSHTTEQLTLTAKWQDNPEISKTIGAKIITKIEDILYTTLIYPNPAQEFIVVQTENWESLEIINIAGQIVYTKENKGKAERLINIKEWAAGMYYLKLNTIDSSKILKWIKL